MQKTNSDIFPCRGIGLFLVFAIFLMLTFVPMDPGPGAVPRYMKDGREYGTVKGAFRNRWWNYYERGLSFADGEFFGEAIQDLKDAVKQRKEDQRMARTYGMHFVDYFPNRELGVVYYEMGDLEAAMGLLELSLAQYPSAKARFYLDRVRKDMLKRSGQSGAPPVVDPDRGETEFWTNADPVMIRGWARDPNFVSGVSIGGSPVFLDGAEKNVRFEKNLVLDQGRHDIDVAAKNLLEKQTVKKIIIHVDRTGPFISIDAVTNTGGGASGSVRISGSALDEAGITALNISGMDIPAAGQTELRFDEEIMVAGPGIAIAAGDRLGNITTADIELPGKTACRLPVMLASLESDQGLYLAASVSGSKDQTPPVIRLKNWTEFQTVFMPKIYLEGEILDESNIVSVKVNKVPVLRREGKMIFFSQVMDLAEGENPILIEAFDINGNTSSKSIVVKRLIPKALALSERLSVAVLPFESKGDAPPAFGSFQENLINALVDQNRFNLVERDRLDVILREQKLSQTDLVDKDSAVKVGKLVAAKSVISGSVVATRTGVEIVARIIDTETAEILAAKDVYDEGTDLRASASLSTGLAIKFHREFPMASGLVVQQKGKTIFTDLGDGVVKIPRRLIVYREAPVLHPVSGKVLGADNVILGRVRITQVMPDLSKTEILTGNASEIKLMDKVITE